MATKTKSKKTAKTDAAATGKAVDAKDIVSLTDIAAAHAPLASSSAELPSLWVVPSDTLVEFDDRTVPAPDQARIDRDLAVNIFISGQKQPSVVYRDPIDEKLQVVAGRTRRRAVQMIRDGFDAIDPRTNETVHFHDAERKLWVVVDATKSKEDAYVEALDTNILVNKLNDVQEAYAVKRLTDEFGWSLTEAATKFGYNNTNRQAKLLKLLELEGEVIDSVACGNLSLQAAIDTAELKPDVRLKVIAAATDTDGKVYGSKVREAIRDIYSDSDANASKATAGVENQIKNGPGKTEKTPAKKDEPATPNLARNTAALKGFIEREIESNVDAGEPTKAFFATLKKWLAGKCGDKALWNAIESNIKAK